MTLGKQLAIGLSAIAAIAIGVVGFTVIMFYLAVQNRHSGYREDCEAVAIPIGPSRLFAEGLLLQAEEPHWYMATLSSVHTLPCGHAVQGQFHPRYESDFFPAGDRARWADRRGLLRGVAVA